MIYMYEEKVLHKRRNDLKQKKDSLGIDPRKNTEVANSHFDCIYWSTQDILISLSSVIF